MVLDGDAEVRTRRGQVDDLLRLVCGEDEFPYFVSDSATLYDVCSLTPEELVERLVSHYGRRLQPGELGLPIWKLVDWLHAANT